VTALRVAERWSASAQPDKAQKHDSSHGYREYQRARRFRHVGHSVERGIRAGIGRHDGNAATRATWAFGIAARAGRPAVAGTARRAAVATRPRERRNSPSGSAETGDPDRRRHQLPCRSRQGARQCRPGGRAGESGASQRRPGEWRSQCFQLVRRRQAGATVARSAGMRRRDAMMDMRDMIGFADSVARRRVAAVVNRGKLWRR
jgi:hypothetical protein